MAETQVDNSIVYKLMGDGTSYERMLKDADKSTKKATTSIKDNLDSLQKNTEKLSETIDGQEKNIIKASDALSAFSDTAKKTVGGKLGEWTETVSKTFKRLTGSVKEGTDASEGWVNSSASMIGSAKKTIENFTGLKESIMAVSAASVSASFAASWTTAMTTVQTAVNATKASFISMGNAIKTASLLTLGKWGLIAAGITVAVGTIVYAVKSYSDSLKEADKDIDKMSKTTNKLLSKWDAQTSEIMERGGFRWDEKLEGYTSKSGALSEGPSKTEYLLDQLEKAKERADSFNQSVKQTKEEHIKEQVELTNQLEKADNEGNIEKIKAIQAALDKPRDITRRLEQYKDTGIFLGGKGTGIISTIKQVKELKKQLNDVNEELDEAGKAADQATEGSDEYAEASKRFADAEKRREEIAAELAEVRRRPTIGFKGIIHKLFGTSKGKILEAELEQETKLRDKARETRDQLYEALRPDERLRAETGKLAFAAEFNVETLGMSTAEKQIYAYNKAIEDAILKRDKFRDMGWLDEAQEADDIINDTTDNLERLKTALDMTKAGEKTLGAVESLKSLEKASKDALDTWHLEGKEKQFKVLENLIDSIDDFAASTELMNRLNKVKRDEGTLDLLKGQEEMVNRAEDLKAKFSTTTLIDKMREEQAALEELFQFDLIDTETFDKAMADVEKRYLGVDDASKKAKESVQKFNSVAFGSAEAIARIMEQQERLAFNPKIAAGMGGKPRINTVLSGGVDIQDLAATGGGTWQPGFYNQFEPVPSASYDPYSAAGPLQAGQRPPTPSADPSTQSLLVELLKQIAANTGKTANKPEIEIEEGDFDE